MIRPVALAALLLIFVSGVSGGVRAQVPDSAAHTAIDTVHAMSGVEVRTSVDPPTAFIGDPITYTVSITYDSVYELVPPPLGANLGAFDVRDYHADYDSVLASGRRVNSTRFVLSTFTTGDYVIPPVPIVVKRKDGSRTIFLSEPVPITIKSLLTNLTDTPDIRPLKPVIVVTTPTWYWWVAGGGLVLILGAAIALIFWRKRRAAAAIVRTPWELAYSHLAALEQQHLPESGRFREYYGHLTDISRQYLGALYHPGVPDMTTEEIREWLQEMPRLEARRRPLVDFLSQADLYKFARVIPSGEKPSEDFTFVRTLIGELQEEHLAFFAAQRAAEQAAERNKGDAGSVQPPSTQPSISTPVNSDLVHSDQADSRGSGSSTTHIDVAG